MTKSTGTLILDALKTGERLFLFSTGTGFAPFASLIRDPETYERFEKVISGHFHKKSDDGHIYYCGTQYEMTWSDYNCPKGFHIFDTQTRERARRLNTMR